MRALTLWQPWAQLIADGRKRIETRSWGTHHRGPLLIHASKTMDREYAEGVGYEPDHLVRGAVLCIVELYDCEQMPVRELAFDKWARGIPKLEWEYGDFNVGRFAWHLRNVELLRKPVRCSGRQGLWLCSLR